MNNGNGTHRNGTHRNGNGNGNGTATAVRRNSPPPTRSGGQAPTRSGGNGAARTGGNGTRPASIERDLAPASVEALHWDALAPRVTEALAQPLDPQLVSQRKGRGGRKFDYIEGHTAIDQANRIFGFGGWGYELVGDVTLRPIEQTNSRTGEVTRTTAYSATVRVTAPGAPSRTDVGFQPVSDESPEGHETAYKGAVTDALKRALRSFGDRFGNGLYGDPPTTSNGNRREPSRPNERQAQSAPERESQPRAQRSAPAQESQPAERRAPARRVVHPARDSAPQPGTDDAQVLRGQLIELSAQQGFSEQQLRDAVKAKTGRPLDELGPAELNPLIASAADKLERRRAAELG